MKRITSPIPPVSRPEISSGRAKPRPVNTTPPEKIGVPVTRWNVLKIHAARTLYGRNKLGEILHFAQNFVRLPLRLPDDPYSYNNRIMPLRTALRQKSTWKGLSAIIAVVLGAFGYSVSEEEIQTIVETATAAIVAISALWYGLKETFRDEDKNPKKPR